MKISKKIVWFLKILVTIVCIWFIRTKLTQKEWDFSRINWNFNIYLAIFLVFLLMLFNWALEAWRWKVSLENFKQIQWVEAFKTILKGLALNWVLPFTSGDFAVRVISLENKQKAASAIILNRFLMSFLTFIYGIFVLFHFQENQFILKNTNWIILLIFLFFLMIILLWVFRKKIQEAFNYFRELTSNQIFKLSFISIFRFAVFTIQLAYLVWVFNPKISPNILFVGVGWIFVARTVLPALVGGIGVRESAGILFFSEYISNSSLILLPISMIWFINIVIPSVVGLYFLWRK